MKRLLCLVSLAGVLAGCDNDPQRIALLQQIGILGQHELRKIEQTGGISGSVHGSFFLGFGSVDGSLASERRLQFYWGRTADELIPTSLPYRMLRFVIDDSKTVPTVEFVFHEYWLQQRRSPYTESEKANPNDWLDDKMIKNECFRVAVIRISRAQLEKEVYLPKL